MTELVIRCTGRALDSHGQPVGEECGKTLPRPVRGGIWIPVDSGAEALDDTGQGVAWKPLTPVSDREYINGARAAGWAVGPDSNAMCTRCRKPDPVLLRDVAAIERSLR